MDDLATITRGDLIDRCHAILLLEQLLLAGDATPNAVARELRKIRSSLLKHV